MTKTIDAAIKHSILIRAEPKRVYEALTTAKGLDAWFTEGAKVDARPGGHITFRWKNWGPDLYTGEDGGPVLEAQPPERFIFQWHPDNSSYRTTVEITSVKSDKGTIVQLREYGYQDTPNGLKAMLDCATGWGEALTLLKFFVEHGIRY
jgi:uncharacterized protein YndB with AHSA1/START domain